ncbi:unnamed protein product [Adineta steineri]|uniref:Uncharacterized protein n=1 Tax=Adineta steineri TaxID=433720 RepID=A0A819ECF6_9BILA|nr:unnamed protein product [Adineta steineri]CAF3849380.1 unnamed protein product [Adineta steineri]
MLYAYSSKSINTTIDNCSICLSALTGGTPRLILSCNHKFHFQCLASSIRAQNNQCPLCRAAIDASITQLLSANRSDQQQQRQIYMNPSRIRLHNNYQYHTRSRHIPHSTENVDNGRAVSTLSTSVATNRQTAALSNSSHPPAIIVSTKLEFKGQLSQRESNIYGLVTLQAPFTRQSSSSSSLSRVPIDLICVVDQSASMSGAKMILLKETLIYITEQLTDFDRLAIISFDNHAYDRSHGLKRMTQENKHKLNVAINDGIKDGFSTNIGCGLEMGIELFRQRQTRNPVSALFLLTDGQDDEIHDYSHIMRRLPTDVVCHTFGYGSDHATSLLVQLAEQGNGGTFTHIDKHEAVGPAFAMALAGLLTCIAQHIRVHIEFYGDYQVTHTHSIYAYEPERLPSSKIIFKLNDLNADEKRNLIFQLYVPKMKDRSSSHNQYREQQHYAQNHTIGHVLVVYTDPNSRQRFTTTSVPFHLIRNSTLLSDHLQVSYTIDLQRNRIETALVLKQAMDEQNYSRSIAILRAQVEKIKASVSAQDPFCQQLIRDLEYRYPTEHGYRSTYHNIYRQHATERGTYSSSTSTSAQIYGSVYQRRQMAHYQKQYE